MHWIADRKSESKRARDERATETEQRSRCRTFGALNEDLVKSNASRMALAIIIIITRVLIIVTLSRKRCRGTLHSQ